MNQAAKKTITHLAKETANNLAENIYTATRGEILVSTLEKYTKPSTWRERASRELEYFKNRHIKLETKSMEDFWKQEFVKAGVAATKKYLKEALESGYR